jgi:hypothetical protein
LTRLGSAASDAIVSTADREDRSVPTNKCRRAIKVQFSSFGTEQNRGGLGDFLGEGPDPDAVRVEDRGKTRVGPQQVAVLQVAMAPAMRASRIIVVGLARGMLGE